MPPILRCRYTDTRGTGMECIPNLPKCRVPISNNTELIEVSGAALPYDRSAASSPDAVRLFVVGVDDEFVIGGWIHDWGRTIVSPYFTRDEDGAQRKQQCAN